MGTQARDVVKGLIKARDDAHERSLKRGGTTHGAWVADMRAFEEGCNATLAALSEAGFVVVPAEPSEEMVERAFDALITTDIIRCWGSVCADASHDDRADVARVLRSALTPGGEK